MDRRDHRCHTRCESCQSAAVAEATPRQMMNHLPREPQSSAHHDDGQQWANNHRRNNVRRKRQAECDRHAKHKRSQEDTAEKIKPPMEEAVVRVEYRCREAQRRGHDAKSEHDRTNDHQKCSVENQDEQGDSPEHHGHHVITRLSEDAVDVAEPALTGLRTGEK